MASTSGDIEKKVRFLLQDAGYAGGERFSPAELRQAITDGLRAIAVAKPLSVAQRVVVTLVPGTTQTLPTTHLVFLHAIRNMGTNGATPGAAITATDLDSMDLSHPSWHTDPTASVVIQSMADTTQPDKFHVYPPQPSPSTMRIEVSAVPEIAPIVAESDVLPIRTFFDNALVFYAAYRLISADAETEVNALLVKQFFADYTVALGK